MKKTKVFEPKIVGFICNRGASILEKKNEYNFQDNVDIKRIICMGRINLSFVLKAFEMGADGFLLIGCPSGECQYRFGNKHAEEQIITTKKLNHLLGLEKERICIIHASARKELNTLNKVKRFVKKIKKIGANPLSKKFNK